MAVQAVQAAREERAGLVVPAVRAVCMAAWSRTMPAAAAGEAMAVTVDAAVMAGAEGEALQSGLQKILPVL